MRAFFLLCLTALLFNFSKPFLKDKVVGKWLVDQIEKPGGRMKKERDKYIVLHPDGRLEGGRVNKAPDKIGKWVLNSGNKTIEFISKEGNKDDGIYGIVKVKRKKLILDREGFRVFLKRMKR